MSLLVKSTAQRVVLSIGTLLALTAIAFALRAAVEPTLPVAQRVAHVLLPMGGLLGLTATALDAEHGRLKWALLGAAVFALAAAIVLLRL